MKNISLRTFLDHYVYVSDYEEVIQENWCYKYDLWDCPIGAENMVVRDEWVGKKIKDANVIIKDFYKPIEYFEI